MSDNAFTPAEVFPPGEFIREELEARNWSPSSLAERLGWAPRLVSELMSGERALTPELADGLARAFGTSAKLWLSLESTYRRSKATGSDGDVTRSTPR
jgi:HTH-type transcriptional regulator/antitoxin HigA